MARNVRYIGRWLQAAAVVLVALTASTAPLEAAPPTIVATTPAAADWVVGESGLGAITIEFDTDVIVPNGAIVARRVGGSPVASLDVAPLALPTRSITVSFAPVHNDRVTLVVDYLIANLTGEPLDGEVDLPSDPFLPTGDGEPGGQAVFQFSVLQGDVNRDGIVDSVDLSQLNAAATNYKIQADLNRDGMVNQADQAILLANAGSSIPKTDKIAPTVVAVTPASVPLLIGSVFVTFSEAIDQNSLSARTLHLIGENGVMLSGSAPPIRINDARYEFPFANVVCAQNYTVKISEAIADISGELLAPTAHRMLVGSDRTSPALDCPSPLFVNSTDPFSVALSDISSNGAIQAFLDGATVFDDCTASAGITMFTSLDAPSAPLPLGANTVVFTAIDESGNESSCQGSLIVVPAIPLEGPPGQAGSPGQDGADGQDGNNGDDGVVGLPGIACWDLDGDRIGDINEDINDDGVVDVLDCRGAQGEQGEPGRDGSNGSNGMDGSDGGNGDPPAGSPSDGRTGLCGAIGMINPMLMVFGLVGLRGRRKGMPFP